MYFIKYFLLLFLVVSIIGCGGGSSSNEPAPGNNSNTPPDVTNSAPGVNSNDPPDVMTPAPGMNFSGQPNILFILVDDMGAETSSLYPSLAGDSGQVPMPVLDKLAKDGIVFNNAWANPTCSPTRGAIISGLYGHNSNVLKVGDVLTPNGASIFQYIAANSPVKYDMAFFGKWHLGDNVAEHGIPEFKGLLRGLVNDYFNWTYEDENGNPTPTTTYSTTALTQFAIDFIQKQQSQSSNPWFVYLSYNAPHTSRIGFQAPPNSLHSVDLGTLQPGDAEESVRVYQATLQALDTEIGRLLSTLGPERDNTIIIFTGDNGTPEQVQDSNVGVRGAKKTIWEGGVRVPLVVSGTGVTRNNERDNTLVVSTDLYATVASLAGINVNQTQDSFSFVPLLSDKNASNGRDIGFTELCQGIISIYTIRDNQYKLSYDSGIWEMHDLVNDPLETANLFNNPDVASEQASLTGKLSSLQQSALYGCFERTP